MTNKLPPELRLKFFVYIIESPDSIDLYHKKYEGDILAQGLKLNLIPCVHRIAIDKTSFIAALYVGLRDAIKENVHLIPLVHISAHGNDKGIILSNGDVIDWKDLRELLLPIEKALGKNLFLLCMSSCKGISACRVAMTEKEEKSLPFIAVVGPQGTPTWSDTTVAYISFYHLLFKGYKLIDAIGGMNSASGDGDFMIITGETAKNEYIKVINESEANKISKALEKEKANIPKNDIETK